MTPGQAQPAAAPSLAALADQCVMCGLCLPHCPTYAVSAAEGRSPRGRIAHMRRLEADRAAATPALRGDLGSCLSCGRCEAVCPSGVRFAAMLPQARALLRAKHGESPLARLLRVIAKRPRWLRVLLRLARTRAMQALARTDRGGWRTLLAAANAMPLAPIARTADPASPAEATRGRVYLLRGCVGAVLDADTHAAATRLLLQAGYAVVPQPDGLCCGSLARQAGALDDAAREAAQLRDAVREAGVHAVVGCASGCFGALREALSAPGLPPLHELLSFLGMASPAGAGTDVVPSQGDPPRRVALAIPCTQRTLDGGAAARGALARAPGTTVAVLPDVPGCCGAGAMQFLLDPATAGTLRREYAARIAATGADLVATTNTGCRLHLAMALAEAGLHIPVVHPAAIMAPASCSIDPACAGPTPPTA